MVQVRSWRMLIAGVLAAWCFTLAPRARAAGVEETVGGTVALGRAANYARVNDFMAVWQNPANLAIARRGAGLDARLPIFHGCFDRVPNDTTEDLDGNQTEGIQYLPGESFAKECNDARPFPYGNVGAVIPLWQSLTLGAGIYTPSGIVHHAYGDDRIITRTLGPQTLPTTTGGKESANRYLLLDRKVLAAFAMVGLGYAPIDELRIGASFGWGFADINYRNVSSVQPGFTDPEVLNDVNVSDWFIPRVMASAATTPIPELDVSVTFTYNGDVSADGYVDLTANGFRNAPRKNCRSDDPGVRCRLHDAKLDVPYASYEVVAGVRYAALRAGRAQRIDPLLDELWDVEVDAFYLSTGRVDDYTLRLYEPGDPNPPELALSSAETAAPLPLPTTATIPHRWRDSWGLRAGGDYVVLPSLLAARLGVSYESRGVRTGYMNIDYWPVARVGLHLGLTARVGVVDVHLAYAHLFQETVRVPVGGGRINEISAIPTRTRLAVNEGRYTSRVDVISIQGNYSF